MDLSKVVLPTFILEPRSMLEKLTDFMSHSDILMDAPSNYIYRYYYFYFWKKKQREREEKKKWNSHYSFNILLYKKGLPDPLERLLAVVKFYVSGFYIKPEGVKKPYNPIIGETVYLSFIF